MKLGLHTVLILLLFACNKPNSPDCFKKTGEQVSKTYTTENFTAVKLDANIEILVKKGSEHKVTLHGGKNVIEKISASVISGTLVIENNNHCNFVRGYKKKIRMEITAPYFAYLVSTALGEIHTDESVAQDTIICRSEGGDFYIKGTYHEVRTSSHGSGNMYVLCKTSRLYTYMNGTNYLHANEAEIGEYVFIESASLGHAYVKAPENGTLEYHLHKSGNLYYSGNPSVIKGISNGTGVVVSR